MIQGKIAVSWKREQNGALEMAVDIPPNTTAEIIVPVTDRSRITEHGMPLDQMSGLIRWMKQKEVILLWSVPGTIDLQSLDERGENNHGKKLRG